MKNKKFNSNWYTIDSYKNRFKIYETGEPECLYLYSNGTHKTKIIAEDLPNYYIYGRIYKCFSYINTKGVKNLKLKLSNPKFDNHLFKDCLLYISYDERDIIENNGCYLGYNYVISGNLIIDFLINCEIYSNYDISELKLYIENHIKEFKKYQREEWDRISKGYDYENIFEIRSIK